MFIIGGWNASTQVLLLLRLHPATTIALVTIVTFASVFFLVIVRTACTLEPSFLTTIFLQPHCPDSFKTCMC